MKVSKIEIQGKKWHDSPNGNTYHSARVWVDDKFCFCNPFQYGYGEMYIQTSKELLQKYGYLPKGKHISNREIKEMGIELIDSCEDDCGKLKVEEWGGKHRKEFKVGDKVTFKPYDVACKCVVKKVEKTEDGYDYRLSGDAISVADGRCIIESRYYMDAICECM